MNYGGDFKMMNEYYSKLEIRVHAVIWSAWILIIILCFIFPVLIRYFAFLLALVALFLSMSTQDLWDRMSAQKERLRTSRNVVDKNGYIWEEFEKNGCTYRAIKNKEEYFKIMGLE
jgi:hypothetical protein